MIRVARVDEARSLTALALRSKAHWGYDPTFIERCRAELTVHEAALADQLTFVIDDGGVHGFYALERLTARRMELAALFVEPTAIGRGYGRALIEHAMQCAAALDVLILELQGDPHARGFYEAIGARLVGEKPSASIPGRMLPCFELGILKG